MHNLLYFLTNLLMNYETAVGPHPPAPLHFPAGIGARAPMPLEKPQRARGGSTVPVSAAFFKGKVELFPRHPSPSGRGAGGEGQRRKGLSPTILLAFSPKLNDIASSMGRAAKRPGE